MKSTRKHKKTNAPGVSPASSTPKGAIASTPSKSSVFQSWRLHHLHSCKDSLDRLISAPAQCFLTCMVIAIALFFPITMLLGLKNVTHLESQWQDSTKVSVFIKKTATHDAITQFRVQLLQDLDLISVEQVSPNSALSEFQAYSGLDNVLQSLDENPLPTVFILEPRMKLDNLAEMEKLSARLSQHSLVDSVQIDLVWLERLRELVALAQRLTLGLAALLAMAVLLIIGNTLRLSLENRRPEVLVIKLVGGTNRFIIRPFLYMGFWYGLFGGILSILLITGLGLWLENPFNRLMGLYESNHQAIGLDCYTMMLILMSSGFLGWLSALLSGSQQLRSMNPS